MTAIRTHVAEPSMLHDSSTLDSDARSESKTQTEAEALPFRTPGGRKSFGGPAGGQSPASACPSAVYPRCFLYRSIRVLVELSCLPLAGPSNSPMIRLARTLPSSTPH